MSDSLIFEKHGPIAHIILNRPQARNAMTKQIYAQLPQLCQTANIDPAIKVVLIYGAGDMAFSSGADISQFRGLQSDEDILAYEHIVEDCFARVEACSKPIIAVISGVCMGAGALLAACCDLRLASGNAQIGFPIARTLGNCLSLNNLARLTDLISPACVKELVFTARLMGAQEAKAVGFISQIVPKPNKLMANAITLAETIAQHAPLTLRATKQGLARLRLRREDAGHDLVLQCYRSDDFRQASEAFFQKRPSLWRGQ